LTFRDIYLLGHYTLEPGTNAKIFFNKIRDFWAMRLAQPITEKFELKVTIKDMQQRIVGGAKALFWQHETAQGLMWRQWVFIARGNLFAIVSTIDKEQEGELLPDVSAMVASFQALP